MEYSTVAGIVVVLAGVFEIVVIPAILKRFRGTMTQPRFDRVVRMTRASGWIVVVIGLYLLLGIRKDLP